MNYELALELKKAGFPQNLQFVEWAKEKPYPLFGLKVGYRGGIVIDEKNNYAYEPTLEELIEACGDGFGSITFERDQWRGHATSEGLDKGFIDLNGYPDPVTLVAHMWLSINKKLECLGSRQ